jgi:hypothetical protein
MPCAFFCVPSSLGGESQLYGYIANRVTPISLSCGTGYVKARPFLRSSCFRPRITNGRKFMRAQDYLRN